MEVFADKINGNGLHEPTEFAPDLPEDYQRVLAGLLARYPEERYADADALIEDLEALQRGWPVQAREPFPKLTRRSETQEPGSGLGLAICKGMVDLHDGQIRAASPTKYGQGATLSITLPASAQSPSVEGDGLL